MRRYARRYALYVFMSLVWIGNAYTQPACTHYASPSGSGSTCTVGSPCLVSTWTTNASLAVAGNTLCLNDGTYLLSAGGSINPTDTFAGTAGNPITIRALNDGQVTIDAQNNGIAVHLAPGNDYWHLWGLNAKNGKEYTYRLDANHIRGYRLIGWNGTSGQDDSIIFSVGRRADTVVEDCAGWGTNARKILDGAQNALAGQNAGFSGFRRCWGEWNDHPQGASQPNNTYQLGYRTRQQRFENVLGTWNTTGQLGGIESVLSFFYDCAAGSIDMNGSSVLGSVFYAPNGNTVSVNAMVKGFCVSNLTLTDVVGFVDTSFTTIRPFDMLFQTSTDTPQTGNTCNNCLSVHAGTASRVQANTGWTFTTFHEGQGLTAATGGISAFTLLPGICKRYVDGVLTADPLWPWPMNQRILDARSAAGVSAIDVTATMQALLGTIPGECLSGGAPPTTRNRITVNY